MTIEHVDISCGVRQLYRLNEFPCTLVDDVLETRSTQKFGQVIFSDRVDRPRCNKADCSSCGGGAEELVEYIKKNNLGIVTESPAIKNPSTGHTIKTYIWTLATTTVVEVK